MTASNTTLSTGRLAAWSSRLSEVLASRDDAETPRRLGKALRELVPFDASSSFALRRNSAPVTFFDDLPSGVEPVRYAEKPYLLDPVYISFLKGELPICCCTLDEICPDGFRESVLTNREKEVVHLTMRGYSDKLTARELQITPGTVRNHKKSIFSKLKVSSQGQVFGPFLKVLQLPTPEETGADPLAALLERR